MDVQVRTQEAVTVIAVQGDIDGSTAPTLQERVLAHAQPGCKLLLDMSGVSFMSSAGLRVLVLLQRQISGKGAFVITGLSESLKDTLTATGFLKFITTADAVDDGIKVLA